MGAGFDARDKDVGAKSLEEDITSSKHKIISTEKLKTIREEVMAISEADRTVEQKEVAKEMPSLRVITETAAMNKKDLSDLEAKEKDLLKSCAKIEGRFHAGSGGRFAIRELQRRER